MSVGRRPTARALRAELGHPVIDVDGHLTELSPLLRDRIAEEALAVGGPALAARVEATDLTWDEERTNSWSAMSEEARRDVWAPCLAWWGSPALALDRASALLPGLLYERLDELGIDFSVLFPSLATRFPLVRDDEVRRVACRAYNDLTAELFHPYRDRLTPAAILAMATPEEAVAELEHVVGTLGSKVVLLGRTYRDVPSLARACPESAPFAPRVESFGIDSDYDYDPLWRRCAELGVAIAVHQTEQGFGSRRSPSRYVYNHIGAFAAGNESICKSLFLGGVTRRFPSLRFAFLEGGVGWAAGLLCELVSHWEKRNAESIGALDPARTDLGEMERLLGRYGSAPVADRMDRVLAHLRRAQWRPAELDDWRACAIGSIDDFVPLFVEPFFFGCEADDRMNSVAFDGRLNPCGRALRAVFGSDIGHWDVTDMGGVLVEAHELVEEGLLSAGDFGDLVFANPVRFLAGANPRFFEGTPCAAAAAEVLGHPGEAAATGSEGGRSGRGR